MQIKLLLTILSGLILSSNANLRPRGSRKSSEPSPNTLANSGNNNNNPQNSLTLLSSLVQKNSGLTGLESGVNGSTTAGIVASATSNNNFINYCAQSKKPLMNGIQTRTGACNPIPMGEIGDFDSAPQSKFAFPTNGGTVPANTNFTVKINIANFHVGVFTNADVTYYSAPCALDPSTGNPIGHSHITIQAVSSAASTDLLPVNKFAFFLGLKGGAQNGQITGAVTGLPAGSYRLSTVSTCGNHQALNGAIAQRGSLDDQIYFDVVESGNGKGSGSGQGSTGNGQGNGQSNGNGGSNTGSGNNSNTGSGNQSSTSGSGSGTGKQGSGRHHHHNNNKVKKSLVSESRIAKRRIELESN